MSGSSVNAKSFLSHIEAKPYDVGVKLTFADWLEEREENNGLVTVMRWCAYNGKHPVSTSHRTYVWMDETGVRFVWPNVPSEVPYILPPSIFEQLNLELLGTGWEESFEYPSMLQAFEALIGKVSLEK